ncbi:hypothetical protein GGD41_007460 [Paraburkholderia bryophila]|uniref:Uncharacterized protein n=1 Tax=Paraburkholderia bryophila TaxID=420952 RepID=A0A7Y9WG53_9BURK|nr:hypothetical protein [Paraburkholderia bryophila]
MRAVGERITVAAVGRVGDIRRAVGADHRVRRHTGVNRAAFARHDPEVARLGRLVQLMPLDRVDTRERRALGAQTFDEPLQRPRVAPRVNQHAVAVVAHVADHAASVRDPPHGGPEADALHQPAHADFFSRRPAQRRKLG